MAAVRRALVTGAAGFVGRHFVQRLTDDGWRVYGFDVDPQGVQEPLRWREDARDYFRRADVGFDLVIHCAAVVGGRAKIDGDPLAIAQNLGIDAEMFRWALRTRPGRVVYFSSSAVYPTYLQNAARRRALAERDVDPAAKNIVGVPDQTYGWAKLTGERLAVLAQAEGLRMTIARPFSGYGEDQSLDYPWPSLADRAKRCEAPFTLWGDGTQVRDWVHVDDVVGAIMAAIDHDIQGPVNICTGRATAFNDLVRMFAAEAGYKPELRHLTDAPRGVSYRVGDPTKLNTFYRPTVSLQQGVKRALAQ